MFSHSTSKFINQHPQLNLSYHISPDVTIEFLKQSQNDQEDDKPPSDDEDFDYFNPLVYCAITMDDEDDQREDLTRLNDSNASKAPVKTPDSNFSKNKKLLKSNENSSFVCNSSETSGVKKKRFSCHICQKTFGWTTDLKRHILIHTGERPFKCTMCFATFTRNFLLQKHKTKIHQCLSPTEISQLNNNVAKNLMEIKLKMRELEQAKENEEEKPDDTRKNKKQKKE